MEDFKSWSTFILNVAGRSAGYFILNQVNGGEESSGNLVQKIKKRLKHYQISAIYDLSFSKCFILKLKICQF